jgi:hypothetical protein
LGFLWIILLNPFSTYLVSIKFYWTVLQISPKSCHHLPGLAASPLPSQSVSNVAVRMRAFKCKSNHVTPLLKNHQSLLILLEVKSANLMIATGSKDLLLSVVSLVLGCF